MSAKIFGSIEGRVGQCVFPIFMEAPNAIGYFIFKGNQPSKILENHGPLVNFFCHDYDRKKYWNWMSNHHKEG